AAVSLASSSSCMFSAVLAVSADACRILFSFYCSAHHRDLHSFPTRRSSDLWAPISMPAKVFMGFISTACWVQSAPVPRPRTSYRSEEHTSELQSRENLVCRLLLEKKKLQPGTRRDDSGHARTLSRQRSKQRR